MDHRIIIQETIDYIEHNLSSEMSTEELAHMAGFSHFHFYKVFSSFVGIPVKQYITRRRLLYAAYEIGCGNTAVDMALKYGFDTYSGFYKAFLREFGCAPSVYFSDIKPKKPYRINLFEEEHMVITNKKARQILVKYWEMENVSVRDIYYPSSGNKSENGFYAGEEYVLKFTNNLGKVLNNIFVSRALEDCGIESSVVVRTVDGNDYVIDGEMYFYLTRRIEGECIRSEMLYDDEYFPDGEFIGSLIGRLHAALWGVDLPVKEVDLLAKIRNVLSDAKDILGLADDFCSEYLSKFSSFYDELPMQIIHRDPNPGNIIGYEDKWGFADFELSEKNIRIYDICYAATAVLSETYEEGNADKLQKWVNVYKDIINGYDKTAKMSAAEKQAVPYIILANQIICVVYFSKYEKYKDIFLVNKAMTVALLEIFDELMI